MKYRQFCYISTAPALSNKEVEGIIEHAARSNAERNIGGFLIYNGRNFLQLLEGESPVLLLLMSRIMADPRHTGVLKMEDVEVDERVFTDWNMRRIRIADSIANRRAKLDEQLPANLDRCVRRIVNNFAVLN